jgi:hypothetical protein
MDLSVMFAWTIAVLAGVACIGALAFVIVWEVCAIRRTLADHRRSDAAGQTPASARYWREHSAVTVPERRP